MKKHNRFTLLAITALWTLSSIGCNNGAMPSPTTEGDLSTAYTTVDVYSSADMSTVIADPSVFSTENKETTVNHSETVTEPSSAKQTSTNANASTETDFSADENTSLEEATSSEEAVSTGAQSTSEAEEDTRPAATDSEKDPTVPPTTQIQQTTDPVRETASAYVPTTTPETAAPAKPAPTTSVQKPEPTTAKQPTIQAPTTTHVEEKTTTAAPTTAAPTEAPTTVTPTTAAPTTAPVQPTTAVPPTITPCRTHGYDSVVTKPATCKSEGILTWTCAICGDTFTETIPKTDHRWDAGKLVKEATCGSDGEKRFTCQDCGQTMAQVIPAQGEHHYVATKKIEQTKVGSLADLGYTIYTCDRCGATVNKDYEGYLDCSWRYSAVNSYRTSPGISVHTDENTLVYFNQTGGVTLNPFTRAEGLEIIAKLRAKQEAYDMYTEGRLDHFHDGLPCDYYYGNAYWGGLNCECCQAGGSEFESTLDATFRNEEGLSFERQGHLQIVLNGGLSYIGIGAYYYQGYIAVVCEYSDIPN